MKTKFKALSVIVCLILCGLSLVACNAATALGKPQGVVALSYDERIDGEFMAFKSKTDSFAAAFASSAYESYQAGDNFAVSPISVYMALSLAAECADGDTRAELLSALGVTYDELQKHFPTLFRSLAVENKRGGKITEALNLTNSIWVNKGLGVKRECIDELSSKYYTYSYSADFAGDNKNTNKAIRKFIKKQTKGLIDKDFGIPAETLFTLINTLYLKTIWNYEGDDLPYTQTELSFTAKDGTVTQKRFLQGEYYGGRVVETDTYSTFFTHTNGGFRIIFILPKDGFGVDDIFTAENLAAVNAIEDYNDFDSENNIRYETRCIFPEYACGYDGDVKEILKNEFGIKRLFLDPLIYEDACDFSTLSDDPCFCDRVSHVTSLTVDRKGIEGAAATLISGATSPAPADVKQDFIIDKAFGFILTDSQGITLFSGVIDKI